MRGKPDTFRRPILALRAVGCEESGGFCDLTEKSRREVCSRLFWLSLATRSVWSLDGVANLGPTASAEGCGG